jgi:hypothetical protein
LRVGRAARPANGCPAFSTVRSRSTALQIPFEPNTVIGFGTPFALTVMPSPTSMMAPAASFVACNTSTWPPTVHDSSRAVRFT